MTPRKRQRGPAGAAALLDEMEATGCIRRTHLARLMVEQA